MIQLRNFSYFTTPLHRANIIPNGSWVASSVSGKHRNTLWAAGTRNKRIGRPISLYAGKTTHQVASGERSCSSGKIREFDEIPEAKGLPLIGTLLDYTPVRGFQLARIFDLWQKRHEQYGDIYREKPGGRDEIVFCRTEEDTEKLFRADGRMPYRREIEGLTVVKNLMRMKTSVANLKGEEWHRMRQPMNKFLLKNKMVWKYVPNMMDIANDLCTYIEKHRDEKGEVPNFDFALDKWAFEMSGSFLFNTKFDMLRDDSCSDITEAFKAMKMITDLIGKSLLGNPTWKYRNTKELEQRLNKAREVFSKVIAEKKNSAEFSGSVLGELYGADGLSEEEKESIIYDLLFGSVETTSRSSALMLYCLTLKSEVQEKLRNEVLTMTDSKSEISGRDIDGMEYVNAFMKEVIRLYPFAHAMSRILSQDVVLSGYKVPAGTNILNTTNSTQNRNPEYYKNPNEFLPERWLEQYDPAGKFSTTGSFGIGARACPGRRFAMQELRVLLIQILRNFKVEYNYDPIFSIFKLTGTPSEESRFTFTPLNH